MPPTADPNDPASPPYYTTAETAVILRLHPLTVMRHARMGHLAAVKLGRSWRFAREELVRVMKEGLPTDAHP